MPFGECHNRYALIVVSKSQSQRRRLRSMMSLRRSDLAFSPLRQRSKKKVERQRRLELRPGSSSAHGQVLSNEYLTSGIGMLGQKFLYMIRCHYDGGCQFRPLTRGPEPCCGLRGGANPDLNSFFIFYNKVTNEEAGDRTCMESTQSTRGLCLTLHKKRS